MPHMDACCAAKVEYVQVCRASPALTLAARPRVLLLDWYLGVLLCAK